MMIASTLVEEKVCVCGGEGWGVGVEVLVPIYITTLIVSIKIS